MKVDYQEASINLHPTRAAGSARDCLFVTEGDGKKCTKWGAVEEALDSTLRCWINAEEENQDDLLRKFLDILSDKFPDLFPLPGDLVVNMGGWVTLRYTGQVIKDVQSYQKKYAKLLEYCGSPLEFLIRGVQLTPEGKKVAKVPGLNLGQMHNTYKQVALQVVKSLNFKAPWVACEWDVPYVLDVLKAARKHKRIHQDKWLHERCCSDLKALLMPGAEKRLKGKAHKAKRLELITLLRLGKKLFK